MRAEGGGNGETRMPTLSRYVSKTHDSFTDFSVQVVSDAFKGKVLLAHRILQLHAHTYIRAEYYTASPDDLLCAVRGALSWFACLVTKDNNNGGNPIYVAALRSYASPRG
jgi:hypothetical protein